MMAWISPLSRVRFETLEDLFALDLDVQVFDLQKVVGHV